jgi:argininosuccinate lyase
MSLYASQEFGYLKVPAAFCTGSSIMPNKLNPDTVELLRSLHATVIGARTELDAVLSLPSGYQRDLQDTKPPLIRAFSRGLAGLAILPDLLAGLSWNMRTHAGVSSPGPARHRPRQRTGRRRPSRSAKPTARPQQSWTSSTSASRKTA